MTESGQKQGELPGMSARVSRADFELACVREFSHSGHHMALGASPQERRERIRSAILRENKTYERWQHSPFTYAEVFAQAYQQPLATLEPALRPRSARPQPDGILPLTPDIFANDDDDEQEEDVVSDDGAGA